MSRRIKSLRPLELIQLLEKAGWTQKRQTGSHVILVKEGRRSIPVPVHPKALKRDLQMAIIKQAGLTPEEVEKLLAE
jgi:predicted RNA binding protein YcfA (HicA-like mRNA interferase family)